MGAFTTRYGLYKPGGGSTGTILPDEVADIDKLTADLDQIDAALGIPVVTSVTLPGAPVDGQAVIESDTKKIKVFDDGPDVWITAELGRGSQTIYKVANLATLDAIADATIGDQAYMTTPGTGIDALKWEAFGDSGVNINWRAIDTVVADTRQHLDDFITAANAIGGGDASFKIGNLAFVSATLVYYRIMSTAGLLRAQSGIIKPASVTGGGIAVDANGRVTLAACTSGALNGVFTTDFDVYRITYEIGLLAPANITMRLRAAGVDLTTNTYVYGGVTNNGAGGGVGSNGTSTFFYITRNPGGGATGAAGEFDVFSPQIAATKRCVSKGTSNNAYSTGEVTGGYQVSPTLYDGFTIGNDTGPAGMNGWLYVTGIAKP